MIALYKGISPLSRAIRFMTWSDYSHAAWVDPETRTLFESTISHGVQSTPNYDVGHTDGTPVELYSIHYTAEQIQKVRKFLYNQIGKKYDLPGLLGFLSRKNMDNPDAWFCSEIVFAAHLEAGMPLLSRIPAYKVTPAMLSYSPLLTLHATFRTRRPLYFRTTTDACSTQGVLQ